MGEGILVFWCVRNEGDVDFTGLWTDSASEADDEAYDGATVTRHIAYPADVARLRDAVVEAADEFGRAMDAQMRAISGTTDTAREYAVNRALVHLGAALSNLHADAASSGDAGRA